jgi:hypothetical protein
MKSVNFSIFVRPSPRGGGDHERCAHEASSWPVPPSCQSTAFRRGARSAAAAPLPGHRGVRPPLPELEELLVRKRWTWW